MTKNSEATPSIKSFFQPEVRGLSPPKPSAPPGIAASDGFSESEVDKALHPSPPPWNPSQDYEEMTIACLRPGPAPRQVVGRIVNLYHLPTQRKKPLAAEGCLKLTVKDVTGVLYVPRYLTCLPKTKVLSLGHRSDFGMLGSIMKPESVSSSPYTRLISTKETLMP